MVEEQSNGQVHGHRSLDMSLFLPTVPHTSVVALFYFSIKGHLWILKIIKSKIFLQIT